MKAVVTGSEGFLGQHLVRRLEADGLTVIHVDRRRGLDLLHPDKFRDLLLGERPDVVYHLAALADVSRALEQPTQQVQQNILATFNVLEAMRAAGTPRIVFTSSAVVYGDHVTEMSIDELGDGMPQQTSIYGACKLASEALIEAYCVGYGRRADIFRLVSVVGPGYRHGNLLDFYRRLKTTPAELTLRGSPTQEKYYIAVEDLMQAIRVVDRNAHAGTEIWNVSASIANQIQDSIDAVADVLEIESPALVTNGQPWAGDLPALVLDTKKLKSRGWVDRYWVPDSMRATVRSFIEAGL